jgi:hypothetical protein
MPPAFNLRDDGVFGGGYRSCPHWRFTYRGLRPSGHRTSRLLYPLKLPLEDSDGLR